MGESDQKVEAASVELVMPVPRESTYLLDHGERVLSPRAFLPKELCGFYVQKDAEGQWYFGRPKGPAVWWEKCELSDLLYLGIAHDDLEGVVVDTVYRASSATILLTPA